MEIKKLEAAIEAILFTMGNSVELAQIADAVQQDKETTRKILQNMMDRYQQEDRGIQIIELEQSYQMCSKKEYYAAGSIASLEIPELTSVGGVLSVNNLAKLTSMSFLKLKETEIGRASCRERV